MHVVHARCTCMRKIAPDGVSSRARCAHLEGPAGAHHLFLRLLLCPDRLCERQLVLLLLPRVLLALALAAVDLALRRLESALGAPRRALFDPRLRLRHRTLAHERVLPHCLRSLETDVRT
eukprot:4752546-Pleurochrysis_carterae.AAC.1